MEGGKGQGLNRERSEIYTPPSGRPAFSTSRLFLPLRVTHSGVHSLSEHLLCAAPTSVTSTQFTGKGLWAQVVLFRQQSWSGPDSPGCWSGAQRGISSSKGGGCSPFPLSSCWYPHNPWEKTGAPRLPDPLSSPEVPTIPVLKPKLPRLLFAPFLTAALLPRSTHRSPPPAMRQPSPHSSLCTQPLPAGEEARRELGGWNKEEIPVHILQVEPAPWVGWSVVPRFKYCLPQKAPQLPKKLPPSRCPLNS